MITKKALLLDLDNTIYPVSSIGNELFKPLFELISEDEGHRQNINQIKLEVMRTPFQKVASDFGFSDELLSQGLHLLQETSCTMDMSVFEDYKVVKNMSIIKFLITTGFTKMQYSKIAQLGITDDFEEIHVVDPQWSDQTKKDVFTDILNRFQFTPSEVLVIGDDPNSEIKAANELGIDTVLYDKQNFNPLTSLRRITDFSQLKNLFNI